MSLIEARISGRVIIVLGEMKTLGLARLKTEKTYEGGYLVQEGKKSWRNGFGSHFQGSLK